MFPEWLFYGLVLPLFFGSWAAALIIVFGGES